MWYKIEEDVNRRYHYLIKENDAILVLNYDKNGIKNYIGANTFLEIGFAHVNFKKKFLLNPIPKNMNHVDEITAMVPIIINHDFEKIQ